MKIFTSCAIINDSALKIFISWAIIVDSVIKVLSFWDQHNWFCTEADDVPYIGLPGLCSSPDASFFFFLSCTCPAFLADFPACLCAGWSQSSSTSEKWPEYCVVSSQCQVVLYFIVLLIYAKLGGSSETNPCIKNSFYVIFCDVSYTIMKTKLEDKEWRDDNMDRRTTPVDETGHGLAE